MKPKKKNLTKDQKAEIVIKQINQLLPHLKEGLSLIDMELVNKPYKYYANSSITIEENPYGWNPISILYRHHIKTLYPNYIISFDNLYKINSNIWGILELNNKNKNTDTNINNYTNNNIFYDSYGRLNYHIDNNKITNWVNIKKNLLVNYYFEENKTIQILYKLQKKGLFYLNYLGLNSKQIQLYNLIIHKQCWDKIHYQYFSKNDKKYIKLLMLIFQKINKSYVLELILTTIITRDFFYI